ncbi:MAG: hypothetical protein H7Y27_06045 [Gemmatimonadaceae bacterium]|nr:hypothetical protein [Chitinophagaceae bacterium]
MFSIFKKRKNSAPVDFSGIGTDMHSHLLPGIDDGSPDSATSAELKKGLEDLGYSKFIATPHIMWDMYKNTPTTISGAAATLKAHSQHENIRFAAEYFLDDHFDEMLDRDEELLTITGKRILVEFSFVSPPLNLKEKIFNLSIKGFEPILAHPERYAYFSGNKAIYDQLRDMGCLFQLNILSLTGYYGKITQELSHYLISKNYIDYLGTDLHHQRHLDAFRYAQPIMPVINQLLDSGKIQNSLL